MKYFSFTFAISPQSSDDIISLFFWLLLNALSWTDAICGACLQIRRASFMSPIFLRFNDSFENCESKCSERIDNKKLRERYAKPSLPSNSNCSTKRFWNKCRLWFSQRELTLIIDGFVIDLYSFLRQWICFCYRTKDSFRLDSMAASTAVSVLSLQGVTNWNNARVLIMT